MGKTLGQANGGLHSTKVARLVRGGPFRFTIVLLLTATLIPNYSAFSSSSSTDTMTASGATRLEMTQDTQISAPQDSNLVFLYFYSETCPSCERQTPIINELEDEYNKSVTFVHINVQDNQQDNRKVIDEFDIESIPTMILACGREPNEQNEYQRFEGFTEKIMLVSVLARVITGTQFEPGESAMGESEGDGEMPGQNKEPADNIEGKVEEKNEATAQNKRPTDITSAAYTDSCLLPPVLSAVHVLPPLGKNSENMTRADQTMLDFLQVMICEVNGDQCTPAYQFTSQKIDNGLDYIKLQNKFYHVNWNIPKADAGKTFEIHFVVSSLDTGNATYVAKKGETVPVRFYIDNHPMTRARVLHEQGYSDMQIAETLVEEFNLSAGSLALVLKDSLALPALEAAQILLALDFSPVEITFAMKCAYELDAYNAGLVLKQLGFNEYTIQSMLIEVYNAYAVIVDIQSTITSPLLYHPPGYTGLAFCRNTTRCTEPYIPGLLGHFVTPEDINAGIGGDDRFVYVKYELASKTSDQPVVTGIKAAHWPNWDEPYPCPAGWIAVSPLTTGTEGPCWCNGMCALYEPFKDAERFVTNAAISFGDYGNPATKCSAACGSNANVWPLYTDSLDIHTGCEDEHWVYFCYNQAQAWPASPRTIDASDNEKLALLEQYAPRVFFFPGLPPIIPAERFYPSSVEWSFDHLFRYSPDDIPPLTYPSSWYHLFPFGVIPEPPELPYHDYRYYVSPKELISDPSQVLEYHYGCNGNATDNPCQLSDAPAYAFWNRQIIPWWGSSLGEGIEVVDLTYFFYFPYNRGKEYWGTVWGSHVGDWEHITVRLSWVYDPSIGWELKPLHLFVSAHDFGTSHPWDTIAKVTGSNHPIVYSAEGSHGIYVTAAPQRYGKIDLLGEISVFLYDWTGDGEQWNTWTNLETFDYDAKHGLGLSVWPRWMSTDYEAPCAPDNPGCDPHDPASGPIYRWGTYQFGTCHIWFVKLTCRMDVGPTGPVDKGMWDDPYVP